MLLSVHGYNLENHLHERNVAQFLEDGTGATISNPAFAKIIQQDNSLLSWLLASTSSQVSRGLIGCMTTASILHNLHRELSLSFTTIIMHL